MRRRAFLSSSASLASLAVLSGCAGEQVVDDTEPEVVHPLAGLTDFDGVVLKQNPILPIAGRPATLIDFWASWCVPCRQSFPHLDQLYRTWMAHGLDMVAVCVDEDPAAGRRFWAQHRPRFPVAWDANATVRDQFGVVSLPTTVLLDTHGSMVVRNTGFDLSEHRYLEEQIRRLVGA
jgi:thiol-disulfide isomerase/thioredoxin